MTDYKALCAELTNELHGYASANPHHDSDELVARARAALAEPEPDTEESSAAQPADGEVAELVAWLCDEADEYDCIQQAPDVSHKLRRAADLLEHLVAEPEGPSDAELIQLACNEEIGRIDLNGNIITRFYYPKDIGKNVITFARAVLARWGKS
jgi:hypothetical protein